MLWGFFCIIDILLGTNIVMNQKYTVTGWDYGGCLFVTYFLKNKH